MKREIVQGVTESFEPVHTLLRECLERETVGSSPINYTDSDVIAIALLYAHVMGQRFDSMLFEEKASVGLAKHLAEAFSNQVEDMTFQMTGIDLGNYYNEEKENGK